MREDPFKTIQSTLAASPEDLCSFTTLEDVVTIGYPNGIWDNVNNFPLMRKGITATHPAVDFNGKPEFIIDIAIFLGSSGSPVFVYNVGGYVDKRGNTHLGGVRIKLLGIVHSIAIHSAEGYIEIVDVPTSQVLKSNTAVPNHLGMVVKAYKMLELFPLVLKQQKQVDCKFSAKIL